MRLLFFHRAPDLLGDTQRLLLRQRELLGHPTYPLLRRRLRLRDTRHLSPLDYHHIHRRRHFLQQLHPLRPLLLGQC
jgi:hypothetical protein